MINDNNRYPADLMIEKYFLSASITNLPPYISKGKSILVTNQLDDLLEYIKDFSDPIGLKLRKSKVTLTQEALVLFPNFCMLGLLL